MKMLIKRWLYAFACRLAELTAPPQIETTPEPIQKPLAQPTQRMGSALLEVSVHSSRDKNRFDL